MDVQSQHHITLKSNKDLHAKLAVPNCKFDDVLEDRLLGVGIWHGRAWANSFR